MMKRIFTRLTVVTLISAFIVPILNAVGVWPLYINFASDIAYSEAVSSTVHGVYLTLDALGVYATAFCLAYAFYKPAERLKTSLIVAVSLFAVGVTTILADVWFYGWRIVTPSLIEYSVLQTALEALRLVAVAFFAVVIAKRLGTNGPRRLCCVSSVIILASELTVRIVDTVTLLYEASLEYENWAPQNISEWMTVVTPYINVTIYFILGYFLCRGILYLFEGRKNEVS